ncbi:hypothetical protein PPUJ20066_03330 [Pseudomonas putida]|nr:hypothetical protein PPUJ20066_03330 [Pseudomonas putida]
MCCEEAGSRTKHRLQATGLFAAQGCSYNGAIELLDYNGVFRHTSQGSTTSPNCPCGTAPK